MRLASHTETNAVFEVTQVLRGDAKLQELSLSRTRAGRDLPENTRGLLLFSQGDNYWGPPKDSFQVGQGIKGQSAYRGWILMDGPGESKEELQRLKELVKQNPYTQSQPDRGKGETAKEAEATPGTTESARRPAIDAAGRRLSDKTMEAVKQLKTSVDTPFFRVLLNYYGPGRGEVVDSLYLSMMGEDIDNPGNVDYAWLPKERAVRIIDHLADLAFFDRVKEFALLEAPPRAGSPKGPTYALVVEYSIENEKWYCYYLDLGWNRQMLQFLDGFRKGLVGEEAKGMDKLLAQLQPERKRWQAAEEAAIERLLSIRAAKWSDAEGYEAHKQLVAMGPDAVPSLLICFQKAAHRDPRVRDPQTVSDFGSELRAALYALEEIGDRRALP
ncbi:MAG TPA: hypothetical protein VMY42_18035, partial [Thermoguttaceae bacterium]|nr:hypothetical protein [Thermoguttaceae bacterium]